MIFEEEILMSRNTAASKPRRCWSVHLGVDVLSVCEYQGYVSNAVALYIVGVQPAQQTGFELSYYAKVDCAKTLTTQAKGLVEMLYWKWIGKIMAVVS